jgi:hypothetical protein
LLARLRFDHLVQQAGYPGSGMVPAPQALLGLLLLKLLDKERRSHADDFNCDEALGLFAGLNVLPKKSFFTEYSYRTGRTNQRALLVGWVRALSGLLAAPEAFSLDFHPLPYRADETDLEQHPIPTQGRARPSVLSFFAVEQPSRMLCYANANLTRSEQAGEVMRFVAFWQEVSGAVPKGLYFDSPVTTYAELSRLNAAGVSFVTIRRRGATLVQRLQGRPAGDWHQAVIDTPGRRHQQVSYLDERVRRRGYRGEVRQVAVRGLGREQPTLMLTNHEQETARNVVIRYASRNGVEDSLGSAVNFFHLDCLTSELRLNVDLDCALTVLAAGCYRWLGKQLKGFDKTKAKQLFRRFVETAGTVEVQEDRLLVRLARRSHNPILREAALDQGRHPVPWLGSRPVYFCYT